MIQKLKDRVLSGQELTGEEALSLAESAPLAPLCAAADEIRSHFCGNRFELCSIVNGKCGRCSENCKFCAQSAHYPVDTETYPLLEADELARRAAADGAKGVGRFSVVTSGRTLTDGETEALCGAYRRIRDEGRAAPCASHGLLTEPQLRRLREAGVIRYHCNLETSRRHFPAVCTTHSYDDKIATLRRAGRAGLELCSGGILGLGETMADQVDMALDLRRLGVRSVPLNVLNPIPGTPFAGFPRVTGEELCRTAAVFRFLLPRAAIRLAGGRGLLTDKGTAAFRSGANAAITGDMLTTAGITIAEDLERVKRLGYEVGLL